MFRFRIIILTTLLVGFIGASNVMAGAHHHEGNHKGHDSGISSPFDKEQKGKSLHCLLNNHKHGVKFCPHSNKPVKGEGHRLSADCGGKSTGTLPSVSFHKDNIDNTSFIAGVSNISFRLTAELFSPAQQLLNSQDPPPEVL